MKGAKSNRVRPTSGESCRSERRRTSIASSVVLATTSIDDILAESNKLVCREFSAGVTPYEFAKLRWKADNGRRNGLQKTMKPVGTSVGRSTLSKEEEKSKDFNKFLPYLPSSVIAT